jgi:hypothetical protein
MDVRFEKASQDFSLNTTLLCFHIPRTPVISLRAIFFCFHDRKKKAKRTATWEYRDYSSGCDDGAHRYSERGIHQLLSGLAEMLATVYWLWRELLGRGQEALVVRLNFVFFTDSVSELYGRRMYVVWKDKHLDWFECGEWIKQTLMYREVEENSENISDDLWQNLVHYTNIKRQSSPVTGPVWPICFQEV